MPHCPWLQSSPSWVTFSLFLLVIDITLFVFFNKTPYEVWRISLTSSNLKQNENTKLISSSLRACRSSNMRNVGFVWLLENASYKRLMLISSDPHERVLLNCRMYITLPGCSSHQSWLQRGAPPVESSQSMLRAPMVAWGSKDKKLSSQIEKI